MFLMLSADELVLFCFYSIVVDLVSWKKLSVGGHAERLSPQLSECRLSGI